VDLRTINSESLYDDAKGYDSDIPVRLSQGLSEIEQRQARTLYNLFNELWGLMIVVGDPGSGKDTFGNYLSYTLKRYFPWKRVLRDEKPRKLYGEYAGLFNESVLAGDIARMKEAAKGVGITKLDDVLEKAADEWVAGSGQVLLQNSILYLTEFWRYCYNREPHNPMNKTMGGIHKMKRHLDCLIIGTVQLASDLDKKTCLPWIDWRVTCVRSRADTTSYTFIVEKVKWDRRKESLITIGRPFAIPVDAGKPRSFIGDGKIVIKKPNYIPENEEERVVLDVLKSGVDNYEQLVDILETDGDMSKSETLMTLKELGLKLINSRPKFVIDYPCYYHIFNSKSPPQITTRLKAE
jgi:hypothetical protein